MNFGNEADSDSLNNCIAKLLGALNGPECTKNIDEVNKMLEDLLNDLKEKQNRPTPPEQNQESMQGQPKKHQKDKFNYKACKAYQYLTQTYFYPTIRQSELVSIATTVASKCTDLRVDRDAKRRKDLLIQWYDDHWSEIEPHIKNIIAFNKEGEVLNRCGKQNLNAQQQNGILNQIQSGDNE